MEWGLYHHLIGFDSLIIFDDASTDHMLSEIDKLAQHCHVVAAPFEKDLGNDQTQTYRRVCQTYQNDYDWIAFIDADEFIFSPHSGDIKSFLAGHPTAACIALPWLFFGSSGHQDKPSDLVLSSYTHRADFKFPPQTHVKSLVRPEKLITCLNPHAFEVDGITIGPDGNEVSWADTPGLTREFDQYQGWRINHYFTKSQQNWNARLARGQLGNWKRTPEQFKNYDRNEVTDESALPYAAKIKSIIDGMGTDGVPTQVPVAITTAAPTENTTPDTTQDTGQSSVQAPTEAPADSQGAQQEQEHPPTPPQTQNPS